MFSDLLKIVQRSKNFFKKFFLWLFLGSVLIHAILILDGLLISKVTKAAFCENVESPYNLRQRRCSPLYLYLKPEFYLDFLFCKIKGHVFSLDSDNLYYFCNSGWLPYPVIDPLYYEPPPTRFEILMSWLKATRFILTEGYYILSFLPITGLSFVLWMLIDCLKRPITNKKRWTAIILIGYIYGALVYYFFKRRKLVSYSIASDQPE